MLYKVHHAVNVLYRGVRWECLKFLGFWKWFPRNTSVGHHSPLPIPNKFLWFACFPFIILSPIMSCRIKFTTENRCGNKVEKVMQIFHATVLYTVALIFLSKNLISLLQFHCSAYNDSHIISNIIWVISSI